MSDLVHPDDIERIVGVPRHATDHYARAVSAEEMVYILHSRECVETARDLRECAYSLALDQGIRVEGWPEDVPVVVMVRDGRLEPCGGCAR